MAAVLLVLMAAVSILVLVFHDVHYLDGSCLSNSAMSTAGLMCCFIIYCSVLVDEGSRKQKLLFLMMIFTVGTLLLCSQLTWSYNNDPDMVVVNEIANVGLFIFTFFFVFVFWRYVVGDLGTNGKPTDINNGIMVALVVIGTVDLLLNHFTGFVFYFDDAGCYYRGVGFVVSCLPILFMGLIILGTAIFRNKDRHDRRMEIIFVFLPLFCFFGQYFFPDFAVFYISIFVTLMLFYGNFYVYHGKDLVEKEKELTEQRFASMYSQIQPHFLYNSLTSIMNLPGTTPEMRDAIADFGKYLRGNLDSLSQKHPISLRMELSHVETYVSLEKMRFKEKLNVEFDIEDAGYMIPALCLQMMVENAIRHGVTMREEGGTVRISSRCTDNMHVLTVEDDGVGFDVDAEYDDDIPRCGIVNTRNLLRKVNGTLEITSVPGKGTTVVMKIPKNT